MPNMSLEKVKMPEQDPESEIKTSKRLLRATLRKWPSKRQKMPSLQNKTLYVRMSGKCTDPEFIGLIAEGNTKKPA